MAPQFIFSLFTTFFLTSTMLYANEYDTISIPKVDVENFESLIQSIVKESSTYQDFKLIKKSDLEIINTSYKVEEASFKNAIIELQGKINTLEVTNKELLTQNQKVVKKYNSLIVNSQNSSNKIYIIIITTLLLVLVYFIYRFNALTDLYKSHKNSIESIETEYDEYKRVAIEREQKIKRELINVRNSFNTNSTKNMTSLLDIADKSIIKKIDLDELLAKGRDVNTSNNTSVMFSDHGNNKDIDVIEMSNHSVRKLEPIKDERLSRVSTKKRKG